MNQVGGQLGPWIIRGYGVPEVWVKGDPTVKGKIYVNGMSWNSRNSDRNEDSDQNPTGICGLV